MGKKLVIGSSGQIGTELILDLVDTYGASNVIATDIKATPPEVIKDVTFFSLDVLDKDNLFKLVKDNNIDEIYNQEFYLYTSWGIADSDPIY